MGWKLNPNISFCRVDGRPVFLDIGRDCYFMLPAHLERAFCSLIDDAPANMTHLHILSAGQVLEETTEAVDLPKPQAPPRLSRSAVEQPASQRRPGAGVAAEVLCTTLAMWWKLTNLNFAAVMEDAAKFRERRTNLNRCPQSRNEADPVVLSAQFRWARRYVPIDTVCLLDSLAMLRFLSKRGVRANMVFAVASDPFSAHCWIQAGDIVLSDTLGNAKAHTPIWVL